MVTANYTKPKFAEPLYYLGVSLINQEKYDEARELPYQAAWDYEWTSPAYTLLAQLKCLRENLKQAAKNVQRAILANPSNIEALNLKTMIMRHFGLYKEALETAKMALALDPFNFNTMNELRLLAKKQTQREVVANGYRF